MGNRKFRDITPFNLRMQPELKAKVEAAARGKVKWSINAEINHRLESSFDTRQDLEQFSDGELVDELIKRWGRDAVYIRFGKPDE
jgi:hypothetical protein